MGYKLHENMNSKVTVSDRAHIKALLTMTIIRAEQDSGNNSPELLHTQTVESYT